MSFSPHAEPEGRVSGGSAAGFSGWLIINHFMNPKSFSGFPAVRSAAVGASCVPPSGRRKQASQPGFPLPPPLRLCSVGSCIPLPPCPARFSPEKTETPPGFCPRRSPPHPAQASPAPSPVFLPRAGDSRPPTRPRSVPQPGLSLTLSFSPGPASWGYNPQSGSLRPGFRLFPFPWTLWSATLRSATLRSAVLRPTGPARSAAHPCESSTSRSIRTYSSRISSGPSIRICPPQPKTQR